MTLSNNFLTNQDTVQIDCGVDELSTEWKFFYNSQLWTNSELKSEIIRTPFVENEAVKSCYSCRGKVRNYEITSPGVGAIFLPRNHSTPREHKNAFKNKKNSIHEHFTTIEDDDVRNIPSVSRQVDGCIRQKYTCPTYDPSNSNLDRRRLRESLKSLRPVLNFASTESLEEKRTRLKVCSISVMIVAVVATCLVLVNLSTSTFLRAGNTTGTTVVPSVIVDTNEASSAIVDIHTNLTNYTDIVTIESNSYEIVSTTEVFKSQVLAQIRNSIKTYPKIKALKPKDIINRDLSQKFCACQNNEVCMLDEDSGTSVCKQAPDVEDPTGCGGLCALESEACQLVDKERGIRVCRRLASESCSPHAWRCRNGLCVSAEARCDGTLHCYDRSDEKQCECDLSKQFRCGHSLSCFSNSKMCDGVIDCWDGYDEANCTLECTDDEFPCNNGQCIISSRFCDGFADCVDGSDEPHGCEAACGAHELACANRRCVSLELKCNRRDDCGDNTDEILCSSN